MKMLKIGREGLANDLGGNYSTDASDLLLTNYLTLFHQVPPCTISWSSKISKTGSRRVKIQQHAEDNPTDPKANHCFQSELKETAQL